MSFLGVLGLLTRVNQKPRLVARLVHDLRRNGQTYLPLGLGLLGPGEESVLSRNWLEVSTLIRISWPGLTTMVSGCGLGLGLGLGLVFFGAGLFVRAIVAVVTRDRMDEGQLRRSPKCCKAQTYPQIRSFSKRPISFLSRLETRCLAK
jgi:hypothetical protein